MRFIFTGHLSGYRITWHNVSTRLMIHKIFNGTVVPLICGKFDNCLVRISGTLNARDILKISPRVTTNSYYTEGDIKFNSATQADCLPVNLSGQMSPANPAFVNRDT